MPLCFQKNYVSSYNLLRMSYYKRLIANHIFDILLGICFSYFTIKIVYYQYQVNDGQHHIDITRCSRTKQKVEWYSWREDEGRCSGSEQLLAQYRVILIALWTYGSALCMYVIDSWKSTNVQKSSNTSRQFGLDDVTLSRVMKSLNCANHHTQWMTC